MKHHLPLSIVLFALLASAAGCSDDQPNGNNSTRDGGGSDAQLFACTQPGVSCNAHDPCAINPVCDDDLLCRPKSYQSCDDGLDCTTDVCKGSGACGHEVTVGCALVVGSGKGSEVRCFDQGAFHPDDPCLICDPSRSTTEWSGANGANCDDADPCTKDDRCVDGACKGSYFGDSCFDELQCTDDVCDGQGGCKNTLKAGWCLIGNACYADQQKAASGCDRCEVLKDARAWTPITGGCKIGTRCYDDGQNDVTGCGICDPQTSSSSWSVAPDVCLIGGKCLQPGTQDPASCGSCDPQKSTSSFTPPTGKCLIDGSCVDAAAKSPSGCGVCDTAQSLWWWSPAGTTTASGFEAGADGFTFDAAVNGVGWQVASKRAHGGSAALYYGDPSKGSYDSGGQNGGAARRPAVALAGGQKHALQFWLFVDVETPAQTDKLTVKAGTQTLWQKSDATVPPGRYRQWVLVEVDLTSFAGQSVQLSFEFDSVDGWANSGEGVYIDDVTIVSGC